MLEWLLIVLFLVKIENFNVDALYLARASVCKVKDISKV
jgi:hypothetical protein